MRAIPELNIDLESDIEGVFDVDSGDIPRYYADLKEATVEEIEQLVLALRDVKHPIFELDLGLGDVLSLDEPVPIIVGGKSNYASDPIATKDDFFISSDYLFRQEIDRSYIVESFFKNDFPEGADHEQVLKAFAKKWLAYVSETFDLLYETLRSEVFIDKAADILRPYLAQDIAKVRDEYLKTGNPSTEAEQVRAVGLASFVESPVEGGEEFEGCTPLPIIQELWDYNHDLLVVKLDELAKQFNLKRL